MPAAEKLQQDRDPITRFLAVIQTSEAGERTLQNPHLIPRTKLRWPRWQLDQAITLARPERRNDGGGDGRGYPAIRDQAHHASDHLTACHCSSIRTNA